jgi:hypothetical protein
MAKKKLIKGLWSKSELNSDRCGKKESFENGASQGEEIHEVPWSVIGCEADYKAVKMV